jgi:hypothetical protein
MNDEQNDGGTLRPHLVLIDDPQTDDLENMTDFKSWWRRCVCRMVGHAAAGVRDLIRNGVVCQLDEKTRCLMIVPGAFT